MNNLMLAATLTATAGLLLFLEGAHRQRLDARNGTRRVELRKANEEADTLSAVLAEARSRLVHERDTLAGARASLHAVASPAKPPPMDVEHEGLWPSGKSYCYLSKKSLPDAFFQRFRASGKGMAMHADTAVVLGMIPEEAVVVDQRFQDLVDRFRDLELQRLEPSAVHAPGDWRGEKVSYHLPPLRGEMEGMMESLFADTRALLGNARADLLEQWVRAGIADSLGDFAPKARLLTFTEVATRGGPQLTRFQVTEEGGKELYYQELWNPPMETFPPGFPEEMRIRFPYRHLFGDNGERRRNPKP